MELLKGFKGPLAAGALLLSQLGSCRGTGANATLCDAKGLDCQELCEFLENCALSPSPLGIGQKNCEARCEASRSEKTNEFQRIQEKLCASNLQGKESPKGTGSASGIGGENWLCSPDYPCAELAELLREEFPASTVLGTSTLTFRLPSAAGGAAASHEGGGAGAPAASCPPEARFQLIPASVGLSALPPLGCSDFPFTLDEVPLGCWQPEWKRVTPDPEDACRIVKIPKVAVPAAKPGTAEISYEYSLDCDREENCADGLDNDGDARIDCEDIACESKCAQCSGYRLEPNKSAECEAAGCSGFCAQGLGGSTGGN